MTGDKTTKTGDGSLSCRTATVRNLLRFDLQAFDDLHVDLVGKIAVYGEEKPAIRVVPDVITVSAIGNITVNIPFTELRSYMKP